MLIMFNLITRFKKKENDVYAIDDYKGLGDPWFYCSLCFKFMNFSELIDGCKCCFCENELFIVPWNEFEDIISQNRTSKLSESKITDYNNNFYNKKPCRLWL